MYGEVTIRWDDRVWLVRPAGEAREVRWPGFSQVPLSNGFLFATCVEMVAERQEAIRRAEQFQATETGGAGAELAVFKTDSAGHLTDSRRGLLLAVPTVTQCIDSQPVTISADGRWPMVRVRYASFHVGSDWTGGIEWSVVIDSDSMSTTESIPIRVWKKTKSGRAFREVLRVNKRDDGMDVRGLNGGKTIRIACGTPCLVSSEAILREEW
jgi:hypothetical protein